MRVWEGEEAGVDWCCLLGLFSCLKTVSSTTYSIGRGPNLGSTRQSLVCGQILAPPISQSSVIGMRSNLGPTQNSSVIGTGMRPNLGSPSRSLSGAPSTWMQGAGEPLPHHVMVRPPDPPSRRPIQSTWQCWLGDTIAAGPCPDLDIYQSCRAPGP